MYTINVGWIYLLQVKTIIYNHFRTPTKTSTLRLTKILFLLINQFTFRAIVTEATELKI